MALRTPLSTDGIRVWGMTPPTMLLTNSYPAPRSFGSTRIATSPNWPAPPVCFLWRYRTSDLPAMVSMYGTVGVPRSTATPYLRAMRSRDRRMWLLPMPETTISFVTSS